MAATMADMQSQLANMLYMMQNMATANIATVNMASQHPQQQLMQKQQLIQPSQHQRQTQPRGFGSFNGYNNPPGGGQQNRGYMGRGNGQGYGRGNVGRGQQATAPGFCRGGRGNQPQWMPNTRNTFGAQNQKQQFGTNTRRSFNQQQTHNAPYSNNVKKYPNTNYFFTHGCDVPTWYHSGSCDNPAHNHVWHATREIQCGGSGKNAHKTEQPSPRPQPQQQQGFNNY